MVRFWVGGRAYVILYTYENAENCGYSLQCANIFAVPKSHEFCNSLHLTFIYTMLKLWDIVPALSLGSQTDVEGVLNELTNTRKRNSSVMKTQ